LSVNSDAYAAAKIKVAIIFLVSYHMDVVGANFDVSIGLGFGLGV
jgi:hypothetical protein